MKKLIFPFILLGLVTGCTSVQVGDVKVKAFGLSTSIQYTQGTNILVNSETEIPVNECGE